jgi:hypothetical protein
VTKGAGNPGVSARDGTFVYKMNKNMVGSKSGAMFYANPHKLFPTERVTVSYDVYFPPEYDWNKKGGKLPGVCLGTVTNACATGKEWSASEGSFRVMFREKNAIIGYAYPAFASGNLALASQSATAKSAFDVKGNSGIDIWHGKNSGDFHAKSGQWNSISFSLTLNTPGQANGTLSMTVTGKSKSLVGVAWRGSASVKINHLLMVSFFGGSDENEWGQAKDMNFGFKNVQVFT